MRAGFLFEVHVGGCLGGDVLAMVEALDPRVVARHTVITVAPDDDGSHLAGLLHALDRAGAEVERVTARH